MEDAKGKAENPESKLKPTAAQLVSGLIISVGEARKLLGSDAKELTDDDIALLTISMAGIAPSLLELSTMQRKQL